MSWLIPYNELTLDQQRAVELDPSENRAILGGPGSGKTQILLHRARYLCDSMKVDSHRFRIFVYTNVLKDYIKSALRDLRLPEDNVLTFDHWCRLFYQQFINRRLPWNHTARTPDFQAIRKATMRHALSGRYRLPLFDFVLVDEGQDLEEEVFAFLAKVSRHVTVCIDHKQQIYDHGTTESVILSKLGIRRRNINLIDAFRVCPYLVEVASSLIPNQGEREAFRNQTRQPQIERQTPLIFFARDLKDEKQMLYNILRERLLKNESIGIFLPQRRQVFGFAKGLKEVGIDVEVPFQSGQNATFPAIDFSSSRPKLMPYHSAKGLTFDSVLMPRLVSKSFHYASPERIERLLFVGITRAMKWCYFSTTLDNPLPALIEKIVPLSKQGLIYIQESQILTNQKKIFDKDEVIEEIEGDESDLSFL